MKAGDAKGVPVQMKWLNASEVWKPAPRLKIDSPCSGTNAAVKTRPSTSDRPYAAFEITIPPYECPTRIFGPEMPSSTARTIATSSAIDSRPRVGVAVVNPSFWSPATTMSQPSDDAQAPWTRTIVGLSELSARAIVGRTETISTAAITIMGRSSRGLVEPRTARWAFGTNEAFIEEPSRPDCIASIKGETATVHMDKAGGFRVLENPFPPAGRKPAWSYPRKCTSSGLGWLAWVQFKLCGVRSTLMSGSIRALAPRLQATTLAACCARIPRGSHGSLPRRVYKRHNELSDDAACWIPIR